MKYINLIITFVFLILSVFFGAESVLAAPGVNKQINFQGKVTNLDGTNVTDGNYDFQFKLYNAGIGGSLLWTETWNVGTTQVPVTGGIFNVALGTYVTFDTATNFNEDNLYLTVNYKSDGEMSPRIRLAAVPYAMNAAKVGGLTVTNTTGTLTVPNGKTISFSDAFTTTGAFPMTITATASTGVTLPTTGTLATLAGVETFSNKNLVGSTVSGTTGLTFSGSTTDIDTATGEALTLQGRAASIFQTTSGTIYLQPSGASVTGYVQIGAGVGTSTPDYLVLDTGTSEAGGTNGAMYYNSSLGKFRCFTAGSWGDCGGSTLIGGNGMTAVGNTLDLGGLITKNTRFNIGGTEVMYFNYPNGSVGIGTTTINGAKMQIAGNLRLSSVVGSTIPSMLILDSGTTEPVSGTDGAMYYHSPSGQFRCYRSGTWQNCATTTLSGIAVGAGVADNWTNNNAGIWINTTGSGDLIKAQKNGEDKFSVSNSGGLIVSAATSNIVKTTTGTTKSTDFSLVGSTMVNVGSTGDAVSLIDGVVPASGQGAMLTSALVANGNIGAGAHAIIREDGKYVIIRGGGTTAASLWDGVSNTMTQMVVATGTTLPGNGAISLRRPDGKYLLVHAGGSAGLTSVFDPFNINVAVSGPPVCGSQVIADGTNAVLRQDGLYMIMCGGTVRWGTYNPTTNAYAAGTNLGQAFGAGAHAIQRDDGTFLVFRGAGTTEHWLYNPYASATGTMTVNPITTNVPTISAGAFSIRRQDGKFLIIPGAANTSYIYDPTRTSANSGAGSMTPQTVAAGYGPTSALTAGAQTVWRQDGKYLLFLGSGTTATNIINESVTTNQQFTAGPNVLGGTPGAGIVTFMRPDGRVQIVHGNSNTVTSTYDIGFVIGGNGTGVENGYYETECISSNSLNPTSSLNWNAASEGSVTYQVKTGNGSCSGNYRYIANPGDLIGAAAGDNRVQVKVTFKRDLPKFMDQEWEIRRAGQTRYRRVNRDPALFDLTIDNSSMWHKTQFDFANSSDPSGPVAVNLTNDKDRSLAISLAMGMNGTSVNGTNAAIYNGAFGTHNNMSLPATNGTVVMKKPDGMFVVIVGNTATPNASYYDSKIQTFTAGAGTSIPTAVTGLGALAVKRPDGKFLVVLGNGTSTTNIFDPILNVFSAGPALTAAAGRGAQVIPLPTGKTLIVHGNFTTATSIYDPVQNTMAVGPLPTAVVGGGSVVIPRPDGTYLFVPGIATEGCTALNTTTNIFNPYKMTFVANSAAPITTGMGPGGFAFQRTDGAWIIAKGGGTTATCAGVNATNIYNPYTNKMAVGPTLSGVAQHGAHAIARPDGTWLVVLGGGLTSTSIYLEKAGAYTAESAGQVGQFVVGPVLVNKAGSGAISWQKDDGKYVTILGSGTSTVGSGTTATLEYDAGWVASGIYKSEQVNIADLDTNSTLTWKATPANGGISAEVKTASTQLGLQTASLRELPTTGSLIAPAAGETWLQINFNFKRSFPSYGGVYTDTWYNGGSPSGFTQRTIITPVLSEYKVTKSSDLVNLKADGLSMFRVTSNGSVYTSSGGVVNTGGADLAENYSSTLPLEKGEVVSIDPTNNHGVKKSNYQYQPDLLGVVSSDPGFVAGSYTENSYPIALVGRVPVKVTTENGPIKTGDRLTSSSVPGYAMRASKSGRVLGEALENFDTDKAVDCPEGGIYVPSRKCGVVEMFVNLTDYSGDNIAILMDESGFSGQSFNIEESLGVASRDQEQILSFLKSQRDATDSAQISSEVYTDNIYATNQIISPQIITDMLFAKKIKADSIEGMEILTDKISSLSAEVKNRENNPISFFRSLVEFWNNVIFKGDVNFESTPTFNQNMAGFAVINKDSDRVDVVFDSPFIMTPIVNITLDGDEPLMDGYSYVVANRTNNGFTIILNKAAKRDVTFSWMALAVKDPKTYQLPTPTPTPIIEPTIVPVPTVLPIVSPVLIQETTPVTEPTPAVFTTPVLQVTPESTQSAQNI